MGKTTIDIDKFTDDQHIEIAQEVEEFYKDAEELIQSRARDIEYCVRFYEGDQWIEYDKGRRVWTGIRMPKKGPGIPRTTSNKIRTAIEAVTSFLASIYPSFGVTPNSNSEDDKSAAKVADALIDYKWDADREDNQINWDATWAIVTGNVVRETFWNPTISQIIKQPLTQEVETPVVQQMSICQNDTCGLTSGPGVAICPQCNASTEQVEQQMVDENGNPMTQVQQQPVIGEDGQPVYTEYRFGDTDFRVFSFINLLYPFDVENHKKALFLGDYSVVDINWVKQFYNRQEPGYTGRVEEVKEDENYVSPIHQKELSLKGVSATRSNFNYSNADLKGKCILKKVYFQPTDNFIRGREVHVANGILLYVGQYKFYDENDKDGWHPYSICYDQPGLGKIQCGSRVLSAIPFQKRLNAIDSVIALHRQTVGTPALLIPSGTQIKNGHMTGLPNKIIEWTPSTIHQHEPRYLEGNQLPAQIAAERQLCAQEIFDQIGATDAIMGLPATNVRSADQYRMMLESSTKRFGGLIKSWRSYLEDTQSKKLKLMSVMYRSAPPEILLRILADNKDTTFTDLQNFLGMNLRDNTNVRIEPRSFIPRSQAYEQMQIIQGLQYGLFNPQDPEEKQLIFDKMSIKGFTPAENEDVKKADWENDLLKKGQPPHFMPFDDHQIHIKILLRLMKAPLFYELDPNIQNGIFLHLQLHNNELVKQQGTMLQMMSPGEPSEGQSKPSSKKA